MTKIIIQFKDDKNDSKKEFDFNDGKEKTINIPFETLEDYQYRNASFRDCLKSIQQVKEKNDQINIIKPIIDLAMRLESDGKLLEARRLETINKPKSVIPKAPPIIISNKKKKNNDQTLNDNSKKTPSIKPITQLMNMNELMNAIKNRQQNNATTLKNYSKSNVSSSNNVPDNKNKEQQNNITTLKSSLKNSTASSSNILNNKNEETKSKTPKEIMKILEAKKKDSSSSEKQPDWMKRKTINLGNLKQEEAKLQPPTLEELKNKAKQKSPRAEKKGVVTPTQSTPKPKKNTTTDSKNIGLKTAATQSQKSEPPEKTETLVTNNTMETAEQKKDSTSPTNKEQTSVQTATQKNTHPKIEDVKANSKTMEDSQKKIESTNNVSEQKVVITPLIQPITESKKIVSTDSTNVELQTVNTKQQQNPEPPKKIETSVTNNKVETAEQKKDPTPTMVETNKIKSFENVELKPIVVQPQNLELPKKAESISGISRQEDNKNTSQANANININNVTINHTTNNLIVVKKKTVSTNSSIQRETSKGSCWSLLFSCFRNNKQVDESEDTFLLKDQILKNKK